MMPSSGYTDEVTKRERLEVRVPKGLKLKLLKAAAIQGRSLSDFLTATAEKAANEIIQENHILQLTVTDSISFAEALVKTTKPNKHLQSAYAKYKKQITAQ